MTWVYCSLYVQIHSQNSQKFSVTCKPFWTIHSSAADHFIYYFLLSNFLLLFSWASFHSWKNGNFRKCLWTMSNVVKLTPTAIGPFIQFILKPLYNPFLMPSVSTTNFRVLQILRYSYCLFVTPAIERIHDKEY